MSSAFWRDRPVLVTGATGLLGSWLTRALVEAGADVAVLIRDWVPQSELVLRRTASSVKLIQGDVRDQPVLERALGEYEIDIVFHLAAQTIVGVANRNPVSTFDTNLRGTWTVLEACRRSPSVGAIVVASSDKAYGTQNVLPYTEDARLDGVHPYDASKSCTDLIARSYALSFGLPAATTRCGNFYGGGDLNWNRIVPGTIRSILREQRPVIRSDGRYVRDYLYVEDGASAYMTLAQHLRQNPELRGRSFNFSNETKVTVIELVEEILRAMHSPLRPDIRNEASNEIREQFLSAALAREVLGWAPAFTLKSGLEKTIHWYQEFLAGESTRRRVEEAHPRTRRGIPSDRLFSESVSGG